MAKVGSGNKSHQRNLINFQMSRAHGSACRAGMAAIIQAPARI